MTYIILGRAVLNHLEQQDGTVIQRPGGSGFIQAEAIQKLDPKSRTMLMTDLGNDAQGDQFEKLLKDAGVITPARISRNVMEIPSLYAYWPYGAKTHDRDRSYLESVDINISALPDAKVELNGPSFLIMASQGTTLEWDRYENIAAQAREQDAVVVFLPNSRPIDPNTAPEKFKLNRTNLKKQFPHAHVVQFADKDVPNMFGEEYSYGAMQTIRSHNSQGWIIVTRGERAVEIYKPGEITPDLYIPVPQISGLPEKYNKTDGGTVFGARLIIELNRQGLNTPEDLKGIDQAFPKIADAVACAAHEASGLIARQNNIICPKLMRTTAFLRQAVNAAP